MPKLVNTKLILTLILVIVVSGKRRSEDSKILLIEDHEFMLCLAVC